MNSIYSTRLLVSPKAQSIMGLMLTAKRRRPKETETKKKAAQQNDGVPSVDIQNKTDSQLNTAQFVEQFDNDSVWDKPKHVVQKQVKNKQLLFKVPKKDSERLTKSRRKPVNRSKMLKELLTLVGLRVLKIGLQLNRSNDNLKKDEEIQVQ